MIRFQSADGCYFTLDVTGYQFPGTDVSADDADWLMVTGHASSHEGAWKFSDACLMTSDVAGLRNWFGEILVGTALPVIDFLEPVLEFGWRRDAAGTTVTVSFCAESAPPWRHKGLFTIEFECAPAALETIRAELTKIVLAYPILARARRLSGRLHVVPSVR